MSYAFLFYLLIFVCFVPIFVLFVSRFPFHVR